MILFILCIALQVDLDGFAVSEYSCNFICDVKNVYICAYSFSELLHFLFL